MLRVMRQENDQLRSSLPAAAATVTNSYCDELEVRLLKEQVQVLTEKSKTDEVSTLLYEYTIEYTNNEYHYNYCLLHHNRIIYSY